MFMKKITLAIALLLSCQSVFAQEPPAPEVSEFNKNHIKLNLFALPLRSFSLQYERGLNENMSVSLGVRLQPKGGIPFRATIENAYASDSLDRDFVNNSRISSWAITPEFRYYFGKRPLNGFYIAPFVRIGGYGLEWTYRYTEDNGNVRTMNFNGKSTAFSGGLLFGAQWHVGKRFLVDWWILGPSYGSYKVNLNAATDLSDLLPDDKQEIKTEIENLGVQGSRFTATVSNTGVVADGKLSLPGLRTGLCIGFTF